MTQTPSPDSAETRKRPDGTDDDPIYCIYFYYLHYPRNSDQRDRADIYEDFDVDDVINNDGELMDRIKRLTLNAIKREKRPPRYSTDIQYLNMDRQAYYVVVVDSPDKKVAERDIIKFKGKNHKSKSTEGKHTFYNEKYLEYTVTVNGVDRTITGVCYTNIMYGLDDDDRPKKLEKGEWEDFRIDLKIRGLERLIEDSGGTNMGPPVPPPGMLRGKARDEKGE